MSQIGPYSRNLPAGASPGGAVRGEASGTRAPRRGIGTLRVDQQIDYLIVLFTLFVQLLAFLILPAASAWSWVYATVWITAVLHGLLLGMQLLRSWPPLFSGKVIGLAGVFYWFLFVTLEQGGEFTEFDAATVLYGLILVQLYTVSFLVTWHFFDARQRSCSGWIARYTPEPQNVGSLVAIIAFGVFLSYLPIFIYTDVGLRETLDKIMRMRSEGKGWSRGNVSNSVKSLVLALNYFGWAIGAISTLVLLRVRGRWVMKAVAIGCFLAIFFLLFFSGTRQRVALLAMPAFGLFYVSISLHRRVPANLALVGLLFTMYFIFQIQVNARSRGITNFTEERFIESITNPAGHQMFEEILHIVTIVPDKLDYNVPGSAFFFVLINPIPRVVWQGKPIDPIWRDYAYYRVGSQVDENRGPTIAISIVGQFYAEGGILMVFVAGFFMGFWAYLCDDLVRFYGRRPTLVVFSAMSMTLMLLTYRGLNAGMLYALPAFWLLICFQKFLEKNLHLKRNVGDNWYLKPLS